METNIYKVVTDSDIKYRVVGDGTRHCKSWAVYIDHNEVDDFRIDKWEFIEGGYISMRIAAEVAQEMDASSDDGVSYADYEQQQSEERSLTE